MNLIHNHVEIHSPHNITSILILVTGLNNSKHCLEEMLNLINPLDSLILKHYLRGHDHYDEKDVIKDEKWASIWLDDMIKTIKVALDMKKSKNAKLYFYGFSLGCIIFLNATMLMKNQNLFDHIYFFAPPLTMMPKYYIIESIAFFGVKKIVSLNEKKYIVHEHLPISYYIALFQLIKNLKNLKPISGHNNITVFLGNQDFLVNVNTVTKWIKRKKFNWDIIKLDIQRNRSHLSCHLICIPEKLDINNIQLIRNLIKN